MSNLAVNYIYQGRLKEAEVLQVQLLELNKKVLGAEHPNTLGNMSNLAMSYTNQGRLKEAEELRVQLLELNPRVFNAES
jgi:Flp pilus assembly protein TadD